MTHCFEKLFRHLLIKLHILCHHYNRFKEVDVPKMDYGPTTTQLKEMLDRFGRRLDRVQTKINNNWPRLDSNVYTVLRNYRIINEEVEDILVDGLRIAFMPSNTTRELKHMYHTQIRECICVNYFQFWKEGDFIGTGIHRSNLGRRGSI